MTILNANEYITKGEVVQILHNAYAEGRIQAKDGCASVLDDISAVKSADVQPLKCGTWERDGANHHRCSVCKNFLSSNVHVKLYNFCPNCGAKLKNRYCPLTTYPTNCKDNCTECIYAENVKEEVQMAIDSGDNRYKR